MRQPIKATARLTFTLWRPALSVAAWVASLCASLGAASSASAQDWRALTLADLQAMRTQIEANTPIPYDERATELKRWLNTGYTEAAARAQKVSSAAGWFFTLSAYANGFGDPHIRLVSSEAVRPAAQWPGFVVRIQGAQAVVHFRDESNAQAPGEGTRIVQCDGKPLVQLARERVLPFAFNGKLAQDQRDAITALFVDHGNPFATRISQCRFARAGREYSAVLRWRDAPAHDWPVVVEQANSGPPARWGLSEARKGVFWIGAPTFDDGDATQLEALIAQVRESSSAIRSARAVVVDLRGNTGGNAAWATQLAQAVFSHEVLTQYALPASQWAADWRASADNVTHARRVEQDSAQRFGQFSPERQTASRVADRLTAWQQKSSPLWRDGADDLPAPTTGNPPRARGAKPFRAGMYLLTNGTCASACLDFIDIAWAVPGTRLLGGTTSADGLLMDVRIVTLPSGKATLSIPQKVMRARARGALQPYVADVKFTGDWNDDAAVRTWALKQAR
jgi:hypothetical protein